MIRISENGKSLVSVGSWEEMAERPGHLECVNPKEDDLSEIIGQYRLSPKQPCGLKNCRTKHNNGFIVVLKGGDETHIGKDCGKRLFGQDFDDASGAYTRAINAARYRENVAEEQNHINNWLQELERLSTGERGSIECSKNMHSHMTRLFDGQTIKALEQKGKRRDGVVTRETRLSEEERSSNIGGSAFRQEHVFTIAGIRATVEYKKLSEKCFAEFKEEIYEFSLIDAESAPHDILKRWDRWAKRVNGRLLELRTITEDCRRFLIQENIHQIRNNKHLL